MKGVFVVIIGLSWNELTELKTNIQGLLTTCKLVKTDYIQKVNSKNYVLFIGWLKELFIERRVTILTPELYKSLRKYMTENVR